MIFLGKSKQTKKKMLSKTLLGKEAKGKWQAKFMEKAS